MFIIGNLFLALAKILHIIMSAFWILILLRAIISWVNPDPYNAIVQFLYRSTEWMLNPVRKFLPPTGIDLSPLIIFLILIFLDNFLVKTLVEIGYRFQ